MNPFGPEVLSAGQAIGLLGSDGTPSAAWFENPMDALRGVFSTPQQKAALLVLLDQLFPPATIAGTAPNEKWHPLLGAQPAGNLYLTVANGTAPLTLGLAGEAHSTTSPLPAELRCHLPIVKIDGDSVSAIAGTAEGPLDLALRIELQWLRSQGRSIDLQAIRVTASLTPFEAQPFSIAIVLEGFSVDEKPPADTQLDPAALDSGALQIVIGLVREQLAQATGLTGEAATVAQHLLPVLGLADGFAAFPFDDPSKFGSWLSTLAASNKLADWVGHVAALLGGSNTVAGSGAADDPWSVNILQIDTNSTLEFIVAQVAAVPSNTPALEIGLRARHATAAANPAARIDAEAIFLSIPMQGLDAVSVIPRASIAVAAPGDPTQTLVSSSDISVKSVRAGAQWDGSKIAPLLELDSVNFTFNGVSKQYDQLDLTHADAVVAAASDLVLAAIQSVLGATGTGAHIAALIGIANPTGDAAWTHLADLPTLVSDPTRAIAAVHRAALLDPTHSWAFLFAEVVGLLGIDAPVSGSGKQADPWVVPLAADNFTLELAAWNARAGSNATETQQLRIGLRLAWDDAPWSAAWLAELLAFDLPASGDASIALLGAQHAQFQLAPVGPIPPLTGIAISADSVALQFEWTPGSPLTIQAAINNLAVTAGSTIQIASLTFPPPAAFDFSNPQPSLGISAADLQSVFRALITRGANSWAGSNGMTLSALLGLHGALPGLQSDWPLLAGGFFSDPFGALRAWLAQLVTSVSADDTPFLPNVLAWLQAFLRDARPELDGPAPDAVAGSGTHDDPWAIEIAPQVELLTWLDPDGPPSAWATAIANLIATHETMDDIVQWGRTFGSLLPSAQEAFSHQDVAGLIAGLNALHGWLLTSDGFVPADSQTPQGGTWTTGTPIAAAHLLLPGDASAIAQIQAQIAAWNASSKAILLLGPAFSDHHTWDVLLNGVASRPNFDLRAPGLDPLSADLSGVTDAVDFYTCDLASDVSPSDQIGRVVARIAELRPGILVTLVAHSTAGLAARAFTASSPAAVRGLITLGTPHFGSALTPLLDPDTATAVRALNEMIPALAAGPLQDAVASITAALDGSLPSFSTDAFTSDTVDEDVAPDVGGVPALAIAGLVGVSLFDQMKQGLQDLAAASAAAARTAPTHLGFGARAALDFGDDGDLETEVAVRCDFEQLALHAGAADPPRGRQAFEVRISIAQTGGWLAGSGAANTRVRWAEFGVTAASTNSLQPFARLHSAALDSPSLGVVDLTHPQTPALLGAMFHAISDLGASAGVSVTALLNALTSLGIVTNDAHGGAGISLDAFRALIADPGGYLSSHFTPELAASITTSFPLPDPFQFYIDGATAGVRSDAIQFTSLMSGTIDARLDLATLQPALDLALTIGDATFRFDHQTNQLTLTAAPWIDPLTLIPLPGPAAIEAAFKRAIPRLLLSAAASAGIEAFFDQDITIPPLAGLLENPGAFLVSTAGLGNGTCLDAARITNLLQTIADIRGVIASSTLDLPGELQLSATGSSPVDISISTATPIGNVLDLQLAARIDCSLHVTPAGTATLNVDLPGAWPSLSIAFGVDPAGVSLILTPQTNPAVGSIQLLPKFTGLGPLLGAATALLPAALDKLADAVGPSQLLDDTLAVAQAFGLYDAVGKFSAHADAWRALTQGDWSSTLSAGVQSAAAAALAKVLGHAAGTVTVSGNTAVIQVGSDFRASLGWDSGPALSLSTTALKAASGALTSAIALGFANGKPLADVTLALHLESSIGISVAPALQFTLNGTAFQATILPLGTTGETALAIDVAPEFAIHHSDDFAAELAKEWLLPIASDLLVSAARPHFSLNVWTGGPTLEDLLSGAGVTTTTGDLATPFPATDAIVQNLLAAFASQAAVSFAGFTVQFVSDINGLGVNLRGSVDIPLSSIDLKLRLDNPAISTAQQGVSVYLFDHSGGFAPKLSVSGLGFVLAGSGGTPLINNSGFRLEGAGASVFFDFDSGIQNLGGALDLEGLGIPFGLLSGNHGDDNPVASSMLEGAQAPNDDAQPVNPALDLTVSYVNGSFGIELGGPAPPVFLPVHRSFGPIYIDQLGLNWDSQAADLLIDATVQVAALTIQTYELGLHIPFRQLLDPTGWSLDLQGLAVGFNAGPVTIAGGLIKNPGSPIEYDGVLSADIAGRGLTVVGSYARPSDAAGGYTSLFIFASLPTTLGGPPYLFVTGLGGGAAYNRELNPPSDIDQVPNFFLVEAMDDASLANNPMAALQSMGAFAPPRRGGYWLAAGVRFNSFVVVNTVAVAYVALDRGFEVGILGVSRLQLPAGNELVNIEMALKARFSSAEETLLIQAQLTDHSWLFSSDCQLTGGFAFFVWFPQGQFVLTIGGYHPAFQKPAEFPDVPRLGFRWQVSDGIQIKGESYFAITSSAFMCGGRLEATASIDGISAWFTAHVDILIQWDPFHYDFEGGIQVGVSLTIQVCFFGACASVSISISRGADIHIFGPPFHVELTFDAYITSITLNFGGKPNPVPDALPWPSFRDKYLIAGNPANTWVAARIVSGLLATEPPGAQPTPGAAAQPWKLTPEFTLVSESRMPVSGYSVTSTALDATGAVVQVSLGAQADAKSFDIAPMQKLNVGSVHSLTFSPALTHPNLFSVEEIFDLLPEATWRWYDPAHLPAAANRVRAITGLRVTATAQLQGKSALIPISTLVDDDPRFALPLPFASVVTVTGALQTAGVAADAVAALVRSTDSAKLLTAVNTVLTGTAFFATARANAELPASVISPVSAGSLARVRSALPLLTPLSTGLTMTNVGLAKPPVFATPIEVAAVKLNQVRLKAVLQAHPIAAVDAPLAARTTVSAKLAAKAPRMTPPPLTVIPGASLQTVSRLGAAAPTTIAGPARTLRNPDLGALIGAADSANFSAAAKSMIGKGVAVPAGATHVWELPAANTAFELSGTAAVRIVYLDRAGTILQDAENLISGELASGAPQGAELAVFQCLGVVTAGLTIAAGFGAVMSAVAPLNEIAASGWQSGNVFPQLGPATILARGSVIVLPTPSVASTNRQRSTTAMIAISAVVASQPGLETWLPKDIGVVMILLDRQDASAAAAGDLTIACPDATLSAPLTGVAGDRTALLYDVAAHVAGATRVTIAIVSKAGWTLAGVIGLHGTAKEWAAQMNGAVPPNLVDDGPLTSSGAVNVRLTGGGVA